MAALPPLPARVPVAPVPRPPWVRLLVGCAIAGGLALLAGLAAVLFGMYWLTSPGRQYATAAVAGPQTQGVVRVGDLTADPGARALLTAFFRRIQEASQAQGPQMPAWIRNLQAQQARQGIGQWLPREATLSLEPDAEGIGRFVLAANMRGFVQPIRMAVTQAAKGDKTTRITPHGEHEILTFGSHTSVCFMDGTLVVSFLPGAMTAALERLASTTPTSPVPDQTLPGKWDVQGWLARESAVGALLGLASRDEEDAELLGPAPDGLRELRFGLDVETAERAKASAEVAFESAEAAARGREWLSTVMAALCGRMESSGLTTTRDESVDGGRIRYDLTLTGIDAAIEHTIAERERARRERTDP